MNDLLDDASDPTSSFVCERERPVTPRVNAALLVERSESAPARKFAATLPAARRNIIEEWVAGSSPFLVMIDLPTRMVVGMPTAIADVRATINIACTEDRGAILHLKFMCTDVTVAAIIDDAAVAAVNWTQLPTRY